MLPLLLVSGQLIWPSGQSLTVRCHYDASLRQTEKLWCLETMPNECRIMGSTNAKQPQGRVEAKDNREQNCVIFTMSDLVPSDSGMYFCAARYRTEVVLQGSLRVRVSDAKDIQRKIPLTMTRIIRHDATENVYTPSPRLTSGVSTADHSRRTQRRKQEDLCSQFSTRHNCLCTTVPTLHLPVGQD
ncbi:hypothetical protein JZ751_023373 [Albula glossodonta]|uniref:Ig-like domain-containing protein n=1 Tax=Albula glossodonta TaxID=121402 RepID=A0A8T2NJ46_9TELE|nr:hypothetical protein JZ751_023373 [Albula glossodonta]